MTVQSLVARTGMLDFEEGIRAFSCYFSVLRDNMTFLDNIKIRYKILAILLPIAATVGVVGLIVGLYKTSPER